MSHENTAKEPYEVLIRSVAQGIREVYASGSWQEVSPKAEALWMAAQEKLELAGI